MRKYVLSLIFFLLTIKVIAQPTIKSFTPVSGPVGTIVTIAGNNFDSIASHNVVYFGSVRGNIFSATDTTITVVVPQGTTYQPITVTTNNLTAYSNKGFIVTFAGAGSSFTANSFVPKIDFTTGNYPHSIGTGDFDNDGKPDLLISRGSSSVISILRNTSSAGNISFQAKIDLPATGNNHEGCAIGDLDGDGKLDFAVVNGVSSYTVSVYRNTSITGNISFASKIDYTTNNGPYSVAIGDLNGDGKPDLVVANDGANTISIYKNTSTPGAISFENKIDISAGTNPYSVAIGDLDNDGKPDIAFTTQGGSSSLSVMRNIDTSGNILFDFAINYATLSGSFIVSIGDLDGDGKPDLAAASSSSNSVVVLRNSSIVGDISFGFQDNLVTGSYPVCVAICDLDGDGKPDLATSNRFSNNVSVLKNKSSSGNISFATHVDYSVNTDPFYLAAGDLDGDERPDIIAANSAADVISILRNITGANVAPVISSFTPTSGINGTFVKIIGSNFIGTTSVRFGGIEASSFTVDSATGITATVAAGASGNVSVTTSYGTATLPGFVFNGPIITAFTPSLGLPGTIVTITGTNFNNVVNVKFGGTSAASFLVNSSTTITATVGNGSTGNVSVITANGTAILAGFTFGLPTITSFSPAAGPIGTTVTITGTNFDTSVSNNIVFFGAVKAVVSSASATQLKVIVPAGATYQPITLTTNNLTAYSSIPFIVTFPNANSGISTNSFSVVGNFPVGAFPFDVTMSDLNNDGKPDLIVVNGVSNSISVLKNISNGSTISFATKTDYNTGPNPERIAIGDLDGDGKPDIVVTNTNSGNASTFSVFKNISSGGNISFATRIDYVTGNGSIGVSINDMNGDGKPDVVVASGNSGFFSIFKNTSSVGAISFDVKQDYTIFGHSDNITIADLDKDEKPDVITANFGANSISIFKNKSANAVLAFDSKIDYAAGSNPTCINTADLDGDGYLDIMVTNYSSGTISLFKNYSNGGIISFGLEPNYSLGSYPISVAANDLDGDGKLDMAAGRSLTGLVSAIQNTYLGAGNFSFADTVNFITGNYDTHVSIGDLDGDGKPELAVINAIYNTVSILKNKVSEPEIASLSAATGGNGSTITITGNNFAGATTVKFGETPAKSFAVNSSKEIDAIVAGGASGNVTVTTPSGTATIAGFNFIPAITADGPTTFCNSEVGLTLTSSAFANNQWYKDGVVINGATAKTMSVNTSGTYTVKTTSNGITTSSVGIAVTVITVSTPTITLDANHNLVSSASTGNQWYLNGNLISGATTQIYHPVQSGTYTVRDTSNNCLSDYSAGYSFIVTGIIDLGNNEYIKLYPNPVKDNLNISWRIASTPSLNIEVYDLSGKRVELNNTIHNGDMINLSKLSQGIYLIKIHNSSHKFHYTLKIIKGI